MVEKQDNIRISYLKRIAPVDSDEEDAQPSKAPRLSFRIGLNKVSSKCANEISKEFPCKLNKHDLKVDLSSVPNQSAGFINDCLKEIESSDDKNRLLYKLKFGCKKMTSILVAKFLAANNIDYLSVINGYYKMTEQMDNFDKEWKQIASIKSLRGKTEKKLTIFRYIQLNQKNGQEYLTEWPQKFTCGCKSCPPENDEQIVQEEAGEGQERIVIIPGTLNSSILDDKEISHDDQILIQFIWDSNAPVKKILVERYGIQITRRDLLTLSGQEWLNDQVINFFLQLIAERSQIKSRKLPMVYSFNTFFFKKLIQVGYPGVRSWTGKVDIFSFDILLVPIHNKGHWSMAVIDIEGHRIDCYDSLLESNMQFLEELRKYLMDVSMEKKNAIHLTSKIGH